MNYFLGLNYNHRTTLITLATFVSIITVVTKIPTSLIQYTRITRESKINYNKPFQKSFKYQDFVSLIDHRVRY